MSVTEFNYWVFMSAGSAAMVASDILIFIRLVE